MYRSAGQWEVADLVARMPAAWRTGAVDGNNAPLKTPARFRSQQVARADCRDGREIRAIRLELVDDDQIT
jgi:hypothetical protein